MRNMLKRMKSQCFNFYFSSYGENLPYFEYKNDEKSKNKNLKYDFSGLSFSSYGENSSKFTSLQPPLNILTGLGTHIAQHQFLERT